MLPESVKVEKCGLTLTGGIVDTAKIDWSIGPKEIAVLLAARFVVDTVTAPSEWRWALYRKSQTANLPANLRMIDIAGLSDVVIGGGGRCLTAVGALRNVEDFIFPYPVVLIRPSQFWVYGTANITCGAYFYFLIQKVNDEELSKLMVKDHG